MSDVASTPAVVLRASDTVEQVRAWIASRSGGSSHQGFPVVDEDDRLIGVVTRRDLLEPSSAGALRERIARPPAVVFDDSSLREAADHMVREGVGRLPVVTRDDPERVVGVITRSDILAAHARRLAAESVGEPRRRRRGGRRQAASPAG